MEELEKILSEKMDERSRIDMEIFNLLEAIRILKESTQQ